MNLTKLPQSSRPAKEDFRLPPSKKFLQIRGQSFKQVQELSACFSVENPPD
jgi:hypothetical protein